MTNGTTWATVVSVHSAPRRRRSRSSTPGRQGTLASSGSGLGGALATEIAQPPAIGGA
jgi:hypothetical protein